MESKNNYEFKIYENQKDSDKPSYRFHKTRYTAALRFGVVPEVNNGIVTIQFEGEHTNDVKAHEGKEALKGTMYINGNPLRDVILIIRISYSGQSSLITFWPISQHPDAKDSYTDPLVDTAMGGSPYDINRVATVMHTKFKENAGVSPALLMKIAYENENKELQFLAHQTAHLLTESLEKNKELEVSLDLEKQEKAKAIYDSQLKDQVIESKNKVIENQLTELLRLQQQSLMVPTRGEVVTNSNLARIDWVEEAIKGKNNQKAIILHMSDGTQRANNWDRGYEARLKLAKTLSEEKRLVRTDVWNMPDTSYRWQNWFKNIYVVD